MGETWIQAWVGLPRSPFFLLLAFGSLLATVLLTAKLTDIDHELKPYKIVSLEFARTPEGAKAVLSGPGSGPGEEWKPEKLNAARLSLHWDFGFLVAYSLLISTMVLLAAQQAPELRRLNILFSLAPFVAAGLDAIENLALLRMLDQIPTPSAWPLQVAAVAAAVKFVLIIISALYVPGVGVYRLVVPR